MIWYLSLNGCAQGQNILILPKLQKISAELKEKDQFGLKNIKVDDVSLAETRWILGTQGWILGFSEERKKEIECRVVDCERVLMGLSGKVKIKLFESIFVTTVWM